MKPKTLLYILIALAIISIGAFLVYQVISRNTGILNGTGQTGSLPTITNQQFPLGNQSSTANATGTTTNASSSQFGIVSNGPVLDYFVNSANVVTIVQADGTIVSIANNIASTVSATTFKNIITASFSYDGKKILLLSQNGTTTKASVFDLAAKSWITLPAGITNPAWSPSNYQIAYFTSSNAGTETLATINAAAANAKPTILSTLAMEDSLLQWPNKNTFIISDRPSAFIAGSAWSFDATNNTLSSISFENLGFESAWDGSGAGLVFSAGNNNQGGVLSLMNQFGNRNVLSFVTLPSKCVFHLDTIAATSSTPQTSTTTKQVTTSTTTSVLDLYCAIPRDQNTLGVARLPDEYDQKVVFTSDDIYKISTVDGSSSDLLSGQTIDTTDLKVFNHILFFVNRYDQKLYAITLQ